MTKSIKRVKRQKIKGLGNASCIDYNYRKMGNEKKERKGRKTTRKKVPKRAK